MSWISAVEILLPSPSSGSGSADLNVSVKVVAGVAFIGWRARDRIGLLARGMERIRREQEEDEVGIDCGFELCGCGTKCITYAQ